MREATGCSVAAHPTERAWIEDVERQNRERPVLVFATLVGGPVSIDFELDKNNTIDIDVSGEYELQVLHTPGHSTGSISLFLPGERALFSGDVIPVTGPGRYHESKIGVSMRTQRKQNPERICSSIGILSHRESGAIILDV
jgi:glyoxylase-like metal-dependent hydrolase (beta-lactamase superfamily II)